MLLPPRKLFGENGVLHTRRDHVACVQNKDVHPVLEECPRCWLLAIRLKCTVKINGKDQIFHSGWKCTKPGCEYFVEPNFARFGILVWGERELKDIFRIRPIKPNS